MISNENKRVFVTVSKEQYEYLERIVCIYNQELDKIPYRLCQKKYKMSVSGLFALAIGNLTLQIDKRLDTKLSKDENYKRIFKFLCPSRSKTNG